MSCTLVLRRVAQREFDKAADWYDQQRAGLGSEFIEAINRVFENLRVNPEMYAVVHEDLREALARRFPFAVYYRVEPDQVVVVAVIHTSRDPAIWKSGPNSDSSPLTGSESSRRVPKPPPHG